jgi:DNA-binding transcriptional MerR regulator
MTDSAPSDRSRFYSVAELANEFSLTSQGIRFYEESGLIAPARVGRTRVFNYQDRARLILIQRLRRLGFSIDAIREYLSLYKADVTGATQYRRGLERITERIRELESKRRDLDETLAGLRALEREAKERLDRALIEESKTPRSKNTNGKRDLRTSRSRPLRGTGYFNSGRGGSRPPDDVWPFLLRANFRQEIIPRTTPAPFERTPLYLTRNMITQERAMRRSPSSAPHHRGDCPPRCGPKPAASSELGREIAVDFKANTDLDEGWGRPNHDQFLSCGAVRRLAAEPKAPS